MIHNAAFCPRPSRSGKFLACDMQFRAPKLKALQKIYITRISDEGIYTAGPQGVMQWTQHKETVTLQDCPWVSPPENEFVCKSVVRGVCAEKR